MALKNFNHSTSLSPTGAKLSLYQMQAIGEIKGVVQINHGMAEHAMRYQRFANALTKAGYHVMAHDHRGHGKTTANDAPLGVFSNKNGLEKVIADIAHVNTLVREKYQGLPVIVFGHSMGVVLSLNYALKFPDTVAAVALWNIGFETGPLAAIFRILLKIERMFKGSDVPSSIALKLTFDDWNKKFAPNRTNFDWLSRDDKEVDKYINDPLCGFGVSVGMWLDVLEATYIGASDKNLATLPPALPFHLQAGGVDPCSAKGKALENFAERLDKAGIDNFKLDIWPDTRHESLNEINRDEITANFVRWLDTYFG